MMPLLIDSVYDPRGDGINFPYSDMKLGPDGKIYIESYYYLGYATGVDSMGWYLHRINAPDSSGAACHLQRKAVYIGSPTKPWDVAGLGHAQLPLLLRQRYRQCGFGCGPRAGKAGLAFWASPRPILQMTKQH